MNASMKILKIDKLIKWLSKTGQPIAFFFIDLSGWFVSLWIYLLRPITRPAFFYGYSQWWFATHYARKRDKGWKPSWDQSGKEQGVFPVEDTKVLVCSKMELKYFQKMGFIGRNINVRKYFNRANYYTSGYIFNHKNK